MAWRRTRGSTDGSCATNWRSHEAGRLRIRPVSWYERIASHFSKRSFSKRSIGGGLGFLLRALELRAGKRIRAYVPPVEGHRGKSPETDASGHRRTSSGAGRFRHFGSSLEPLSAWVLSIEVPG